MEVKLLEGQLSSVQELSFAFKRAASRLVEMASSQYAKTYGERLHRAPSG